MSNKEDFNNYKNIIFDYDNTIAKIPIDWLKLRIEYKIFLKRNFPQINLSKCLRVDEMESNAISMYPEMFDLIFSIRQKVENLHKGMHIPLYRTISLIEELENNTLIIISNNFRQTVYFGLRQLGIKDKFKTVIGIDQSRNPKPSTNAWRVLSNEMNISSHSTIFIGDSCNTDKLFANNIGIPFFHVNDL